MNNAATSETIESTVKKYLASNSLTEFGGKVTENTDLFEEGFIDSFGYIELVKFLEKEFQIRFTDDELVSNQLNTLNNITNMVQSKVNAG